MHVAGVWRVCCALILSDRMTETPKPVPVHTPKTAKSEHGLARSAEALRANLLKRKAQKRARATAAPETPQPPKAD